MNSFTAVHNLRRRSQCASAACVVCCLLSIALSSLWVYQQVNARHHQVPASHATSAAVIAPTKPRAVDHVTIVSDLIEQELPAHPDKTTLARLIVTESHRANIDPLFITAVVHTESRFKNRAVSHRGAKGLMQLMPATGRYVAKLSKIELKSTEALHNPETNIKLGIWYLKHLHDKFQGDREQALLAYNWGPANLRRALATGLKYPEESVQYVQRVISHYAASAARRRQYALEASQSNVG